MNSQSNIWSHGIVADSSVIINLACTGYSKQILSALPGPVVITRHVQTELDNGKKHGHTNYQILDELIQLGVITVHSLNNEAGESFLELVSGRTASSIADGEASTIAFAQSSGFSAIMDDRKAIIVCRQLFPDVTLFSTVDILSSEFVSASLNKAQIKEAVCGALQQARMRVHEDNIKWVAEIIGSDNLSQYSSLQRYKNVNQP